MEKQLSISKTCAGLGAKIAGTGLQCSLLSLLAFLPIGGLALLSPEKTPDSNYFEFILAALLLSRFLTPPIAALIVAYLARRDKRLSPDRTLWCLFRTNAFPSIGLVLAVAIFGFFAGTLFLVPGIVFLLATCVVLPVLVIEGVSSPAAVKRSWELTRDHRWVLLLFWSAYLAISSLILAAIVWFTTTSASQFTESIPLVQTDAFLPIVFACALLYAGLVIASYEVYTQLVPPSSED